ncbi:MAG: phosphatidate cytidylyltransferase [Kiritimatiellae bacterium]|nr:phosphatidate cytidylyltransferase [Kiritimatiellia bacterium]
MNKVLKRTVTGIAVGAAVIVAILLAPVSAIAPAVACLVALAVVEFALLLRMKLPRLTVLSAAALVVGAAVIACGLWALVETAHRHGSVMLLYIVAIVKFSDVGGFAFGVASARFMKGGNHRLCPSISPGKSWEGLLGSVVFSCVVSLAFVPATHFAVAKALAFGVAAALVGTAGDLVESKFKRWVGVKDSSALKITNGMGGILDMVDSLLFAPAVLLPFI